MTRKKKPTITCLTDQEVTLEGVKLPFRDAHLKLRDCDGDPCLLRVHAVASMVAYCARTHESIKGRTVTLARVPCHACTALLASARPGQVVVQGTEPLNVKGQSSADPEMQLLAVSVPLEVR